VRGRWRARLWTTFAGAWRAVSAAGGHGRRLSALDASFLRLDSARAHMHVGWSAVFAAPGGGERPTVQALRERVAGRLHEVPFCRWRLQLAPLALSEPRWVDDPRFDVAAHVTAPTGPDERVSYDRFAALRDAVLSEPLDRSRPLWQILLIPRLQDGRVGMVGKVHHALVDGIAALQVAGLVVDREPDAPFPAPERWRPEGPGGPVGWARDALMQATGEGFRALRATAAAATRPRTSVRQALQGVGRAALAAREDILPRAPACALNVPIGARRSLVGYHAPRAALRDARAGGGTLNDVGLAVVAGALRAHALRHGEPPQAPLKAMVPVSMRRPDEIGSGNRISMVYIQLPVNLRCPRERLEWVRAQTERLKHGDRPAGTQTLYRGAGLVPTPLRSPLVRAMASPRAFNLTISQSPAPRGAIHLLGCELQEVYSVVPIAQGHALAIGMVRYRGELFFGCHADPDAFPGVHALPALLEAEIRELGRRAPARPVAHPRARSAVS
jgi:diacylglycerol O-acyltransferase